MYLPVHDRSLQRTASPENDDSVRSLFFKKFPFWHTESNDLTDLSVYNDDDTRESRF